MKKLRSTLGKMEIALGSVSDAIVWTDEQGCIQWCNATFDRWVQLPHLHTLNQPFLQVLPLKKNGHPVNTEAGEDPIGTAKAGGRSTGIYEYRGDRVLEINSSRVEFHEGETCVVLALRDITGDLQTASAIRHLTRRNELLLNAAGEGIYGVDLRGITTFANPSAAEMLGWTVQEMIGCQQHDLSHHSRPDGSRYPIEDCPIHLALRDGRVHRVDYEMFWRKDGSSFPVEYTSTPIREGAEIVGAVVVFRDITERRQSEEARRLQFEHLVLLQEITGAANEASSLQEVMQFTIDQICSRTKWVAGHVYIEDTANPGAGLIPSRLWHLQRSPALDSFKELTEQISFTPGRGLPGRMLESGRPCWIKEIAADDDFSRKEAALAAEFVSALAVPVRTDDEVVAVLEFFSTDPMPPDEVFLELMSHIGNQLGQFVLRKRIEEQLVASEGRLIQAQQLAHVGSWQWEVTSSRLTWSAELYRIYGRDPAGPEITFRDFVDSLHPEDRDFIRKEIDRAFASHEPFAFDHRIVRPDGEVRICNGRGEVILNEEGEPVMMVGTAQDVTERKTIENELKMLAERLAQSNRELTDFAYVASHDLQEPLRKIRAFGDRLNDKYSAELGSSGRDYLGRMQSAARRMQILIDDLLSFSRITTKANPFEPVDLNELGNEVLSDLETAVQEKQAQVVVGDLPVIEADALQLRQLFQNLISNGLKFQTPGRAPVLEISGVVVRPENSNGDAKREDPPLCLLTFQDNGIGFETKYSQRIFDIFERLHGRGAYPGTGIGLAICRKIAERHGGSIRAESRVGEGSRFVVTLPIQQSQKEP